MSITTHILDTARGRPAAGVPIVLDKKQSDGSWARIGQGETDSDGRLRTLVPQGVVIEASQYRITFDTGAYFKALGVVAFYPEVSVVFEIVAPHEHHHVPLLLNPFGFSTYRGS